MRLDAGGTRKPSTVEPTNLVPRANGGISRAEPQGYDLARAFPEAFGHGPGHEPGVADYLRILQKRKWTIAATVVIAFTLSAIYSFRATPKYEAIGRIALNPGENDVLGIKEPGTGGSDYDGREVDTQLKILQSDAVALTAARKLQQSAGQLEAPAQDSRRESEMLDSFRGGMRVTVVPETRIMEVRYVSPDPRYAADAVNAITNAYVEQNFKTKYESTMRASDWLTKQLADLQMRVETSQQKLVDYQKTHGIVGVDEKQNITTAKLDDLNRQLTDAEADRIQKQAIYEQAKLGERSVLANTSPNQLVDKLRAQEADLKNQLAQMTVQFGPSYPKVAEVSSQLKETQAAIEQETRKIQGKLESEYLSALSRQRMLRGALEKQKQEANLLNEKAIQYMLLKRDVDSNRQLYEGLLTKLKEAGISAGLRSNNIRIVDPARVPTSPSQPNIPRNLAMALMLGLMGGIAIAFIQEMLDNTVKTPEEAQSLSALPSLGMIPMNHRLAEKEKGSNGRSVALTRQSNWRDSVELITHSRPKSEIAEAYRALRTSILLSTTGTPPKVILITSALPQEGKTTSAINTAIVLAQKGSRVLLVDADLRRPSVHTKLSLRMRGGLSTLLTGSDTLQSVIINSTEIPNLVVMPAGPPPPHPAELLGSAVMKEYLRQWREQYDHILIDSPPCLSVTDAVLMSVDADATILVVRSATTTKEALRRARNLLVQVNARVLGVVVNAVDLRSPDMYYYQYASKYGGKYYDNDAQHQR